MGVAAAAGGAESGRVSASLARAGARGGCSRSDALRAERTAETFVVTPGFEDAFDRALGLVGSALRDGKSQAAYLHGSFGSGKSHFMALLSLLLRDHPAAWAKPELHAPDRYNLPECGDLRRCRRIAFCAGADGSEINSCERGSCEDPGARCVIRARCVTSDYRIAE